MQKEQYEQLIQLVLIQNSVSLLTLHPVFAKDFLVCFEICMSVGISRRFWETPCVTESLIFVLKDASDIEDSNNQLKHVWDRSLGVII